MKKTKKVAMKDFNFNLPLKDHKKLKRLSKKTKTPMAAMLREKIKEMIQK